jgi:hypothetical protein
MVQSRNLIVVVTVLVLYTLSQMDPARELATAWAMKRKPRRPSRTPG